MLNFPNFFTFTRILLILPFIFLLIHGLHGWALAVFIVAGLTDTLDGALARMLHQRTTLGAYLDPAADKLLMASSFVVLTVMGLLPLWLTALVIGRDVIIVSGILLIRLRSLPLEMSPSWVSKLTTILQLATIGASLLYLALHPLPPLKEALIAATAVGTVISGAQYIRRGIDLLKRGGG